MTAPQNGRRNWRRNKYYCAVCAREMRPSPSKVDGRALYGADGMCNACKMVERNRYAPVSYRTARMDRETFRIEYETLRSGGIAERDMPRRLAMTPAAFTKQLHRARSAGHLRKAA